MTRLQIALMVAMLLVIGIVASKPRQVAEMDCNFSDDPIACILRQHGDVR